MKIYFYSYLIGLFLLGSCATILNRPYKTVTISTNVPTKLIYSLDTFFVKEEVKLICPRSKSSVYFKTITDSVVKKYEIKSKPSSTIALNFIGYISPGMVIDGFSPKKYSYPHYVTISPKDSSQNYKTYRPTYKNDIFLSMYLPFASRTGSFIGTNGDIISTNMFSAIGVGLDFFHQPNSYINVNLNVLDAYSSQIKYASITNNHQVKRLTFGYGLSLSDIKNKTYTTFNTLPTYSDSTKENFSAGLLFNIYLQTGKYLNIGFVYKPSIYVLNSSTPFQYQQVIAIDLRFRFRLKKGFGTTPSKFRDNFKHILFPE